MSIVTIPEFAIPDQIKVLAGSVGGVVLDATDEYLGQVVTFYEASTIRYIHFKVNTVTTAGTFKVSIQTIADSSQPATKSGTIEASGNAYATVTISATGWQRVQLTADYTPTIGDKRIIVIEMSNFTTQNVTISNGALQNNLDTSNYGVTYVGGTLASSVARNYGCFVLESSTGIGIRSSLVIGHSITGSTYNTSSTNDEYGNVINLPVKVRVIGIGALLDSDGSFEFKAYVGASSYSVAGSSNIRSSTAAVIRREYFSSPFEVDANSDFKVTALATSSISIVLALASLPTSYESVAVAAMSLGKLSRVFRNEGGAWSSEDATQFSGIFPIIDGIDIPTGGGTSLYLPRTRLIGA